jgi:hypothetical protein
VFRIFEYQIVQMVRQRFVINPIEKSEDSQGYSTAFYHLKTFATRLGQRKTITQLQAEAEGSNELKRTLGSFQLLALGIGGIIGKFNAYVYIDK